MECAILRVDKGLQADPGSLHLGDAHTKELSAFHLPFRDGWRNSCLILFCFCLQLFDGFEKESVTREEITYYYVLSLSGPKAGRDV